MDASAENVVLSEEVRRIKAARRRFRRFASLPSNCEDIALAAVDGTSI